MKEVKKTDINEIIQDAFIKYKLTKKYNQVVTVIYREYKKNNLTESQVDYITKEVNKKIAEHKEKKEQEIEKQMQEEIETLIK